MNIDFWLKILPNFATFLLIICYVPQIYSLHTKKKNEVSILFFVLLILALFTFLIYNILLFFKYGEFHGIITEGANVVLALVVLIQTVNLKRKQK